MSIAPPRPLTGPPPAEVPLTRAPLVRVIAQVRFPQILSIRNPDKVAGFQDAIRGTYPVLVEEPTKEVIFIPPGEPEIRDSRIWRFLDHEPEWKWRASVSPDFVALETNAYQSRTDFLARLETIVAAAEDAFNPAEARRLGVRYIDRLTDAAVARVDKLIQPKVLGIALEDGKPPVNLAAAAAHLLTEARFIADEGQIQARWGSLPGNATIDPNALDPIPDPSWVMDLDMFTEKPQAFMTASILSEATSFTQRIYSVFREMITDEFLKYYGGRL
jgi:uncharacterized protein (TIGR04255 family)